VSRVCDVDPPRNLAKSVTDAVAQHDRVVALVINVPFTSPNQ